MDTENGTDPIPTRKGEWVVVDLRNSHHPGYQAVKPESREGCDRLLAKSLEGWFE